MTRLLAGLFALVLAFAFPASAQQGITPCSNNSISVTNTSGNVQLSACGMTVLMWNTGTQELFYRYGSASTTAAVATDNSLPGNSFVVLNLGSQKQYLAAITASSTTTLRITQGQTR